VGILLSVSRSVRNHPGAKRWRFRNIGIDPARNWTSLLERDVYLMKKLQLLTRLAVAGLLLAGLSVSLFAQSKDDHSQRDRLKNETTMTGCLSKAEGAFTLTDEKTGDKTTVTGAADLEKHSANHRVTLTGTAKTDASGKSIFEVSKIEHLGTSCTPK